MPRNFAAKHNSTAPRLLLLGASTGVRASLESARAAGFHVVAIDGSADAGAFDVAAEKLVADIGNASVIEALARELDVDGIVATTDHAVHAAAVASSSLSLPGIDPDTALRATRKSLMRKCWASAGIPGPRTAIARTDSEISRAVSALGLPLVIKPANSLGGGSRGVSMAMDRAQLSAAVRFARMHAPDGELLLEQCIDAHSEHSVELLFVDNVGHVIATGDKVKSPAPYRVDLEVRYPTQLSARDMQRVGETAIAAARALGISSGAAHVELACTANGVMLFELGARCGGGATAAPLVPWVTGVDQFAEVCRVACGMAPSGLVAQSTNGGCYRFITPRAGSIVSHEALEDVRRIAGVLEVNVWAAEGSVATRVRTGRDRVGAVVTGAATREEAIGIADIAAAMIEMDRSMMPA